MEEYEKELEKLLKDLKSANEEFQYYVKSDDPGAWWIREAGSSEITEIIEHGFRIEIINGGARCYAF